MTSNDHPSRSTWTLFNLLSLALNVNISGSSTSSKAKLSQGWGGGVVLMKFAVPQKERGGGSPDPGSPL